MKLHAQEFSLQNMPPSSHTESCVHYLRRVIEAGFRHLAFRVVDFGNGFQVFLNSAQDMVFTPTQRSQASLKLDICHSFGQCFQQESPYCCTAHVAISLSLHCCNFECDMGFTVN